MSLTIGLTTCMLCLTKHRGTGYCHRCIERATRPVKVPRGVVRTPYTKLVSKPRPAPSKASERTEPTHVVITRCAGCCWCGEERPTQNSAWCGPSCQNRHYKWRKRQPN